MWIRRDSSTNVNCWTFALVSFKRQADIKLNQNIAVYNDDDDDDDDDDDNDDDDDPTKLKSNSLWFWMILRS